MISVYGDYRQALLRLFPEIGLEKIGFVSLECEYLQQKGIEVINSYTSW